MDEMEEMEYVALFGHRCVCACVCVYVESCPAALSVYLLLVYLAAYLFTYLSVEIPCLWYEMNQMEQSSIYFGKSEIDVAHY